MMSPANLLLGLIRCGKTSVKSLAAVVLLLLLTLGWLTGTETGTRWLLRNVLSTVDQLSVAAIDGTLLKQLTLRQLHYQEQDQFSVAVAQISLQWRPAALFRGQLHIESLQSQGIDIKGQPPAGAEDQGKSEIPSIPLNITIDEFSLEQLNWQNGDSSQEIHQLTFRAKLEHNTLGIAELALTMPQLRINARSSVQLQPDWPLTTALDWFYHQEDVSLQGHLSLTGNWQRYDLISRIEGSAETSQSGFISLDSDQPEFAFSGDWTQLRWPLSGVSQVNSHRGEFVIQGTLQQYLAKLSADVSARDQPDFSVAFAGQGSPEQLAIERLLLKPARGQIALSGSLSWAQALAFDLKLAAEQLNPADFGVGVPGQLAINAQGKGSIAGEQYQAELVIEQLRGKLYDQPLTATGTLTLAQRQLGIDGFQVSAGRNQLKATGYLNEQQADIALQIAAPDLRSAWPTLAGSLNGNATLKGSLQKPAITGTLQGRNLSFADKRVASLALKADYEHLSSRPSLLEFSAGNVQLGENKIDRISLQGHGNPDRHQFRLDLASSLATLQVQTDGQWDGKQWQGKISQLAIEHPQLKHWQLQSPVILTLAKNEAQYRLDLPDSCLLQATARLCLSAQGWPQQLEGNLSLTGWPLAAAKPWLPEEMSLSGSVSAQAQLTSHADDLMAEINIKLADGEARFKDEDNVTHEQAFTVSAAQLQYRQDQLQAQLRLDLGQQDFINAEIEAGEAGRDGMRRLGGKIKAKIATMRLLDSLLPDINQLQGLITADLNIGGDSEHPVIVGNAQWREGQFTIPRLGSVFRHIEIKAESTAANPERLLFNAALESGEGKLTGTGWLDLLAEENFPLQLALRGERFQLSQLPEAVIAVSPTFDISKRGKLTTVAGLILIDSAQVELKNLPESAIAPSEDEVIVGADRPRQQVIDPSRLHARVAIDFGEHSRFEGFGLKTKLSGRLDYIMNENQQSMQGRARMEDATYRSYGQDLTIRKGEFLFNGPADNPWLTIEAIRKAINDNVTAVLSVTGPLKSPQTRVYTEPSLPESEALSYLVTGKSTQWLGKSDGNAVASAAFNYGAGQLSWISDQLGIDEFEFEQGEKIEDSAVKLGQYLNPDLYIGVTMGLFANKYAADLRYRLSKHFSINTRAGETQRIDLKYHLETD